MALEGSFEDMSLADLFQVFRMGSKTGVLLLYNRRERGVIYVAQGGLVDAFVVTGSERQVLATRDEAVLYMLGWASACFIFRHDPAVAARAPRITHDAEWLVLESMRRHNNPQHTIPQYTLTLDTRIQLAPMPGNTESHVSLDVDQWRILSHAANSATVREICADTKMPEVQVIRLVSELLAVGLIDVTTNRVQPPARPPKPAHDPANAPIHLQPAASASAAPPDAAPPIKRSLLSAILRRVSEL